MIALKTCNNYDKYKKYIIISIIIKIELVNK